MNRGTHEKRSPRDPTKPGRPEGRPAIAPGSVTLGGARGQDQVGGGRCSVGSTARHGLFSFVRRKTGRWTRRRAHLLHRLGWSPAIQAPQHPPGRTPDSGATSTIGSLAAVCILALGFTALPGLRADDPETNAFRRAQFREPGGGAYRILATAASASQLAPAAADSWTRAQRDDGPGSPVELGSRVVLKLDGSRDLGSYLSGLSVRVQRTVRTNLFILQAADSATAIHAAESLATQDGVLAAYPVMRRPLKRHNPYAQTPNDPRFAEQWHLDNRNGSQRLAGPDLNVRAAWPVTQGDGILVAVADDGVQLDHPDLVANTAGAPHHNFYLGTGSGGPASTGANHATAVAGLISATANNNRGVAGVAPQAQLASWVIFGTTFGGSESIASDEQLMEMFEYALDRVGVQNHSWGSSTVAQLALDPLGDAGVDQAVRQGREGRGVVIVRAAGNAREDLTDANDDGYANDPRVIAVAAVRKDGRACTYSSPGACLLVGAPSGDLLDTNGDGTPDAVDPAAPDVLTTDRTGNAGYTITTGTGDAGDYTTFNGTSASSPQVAGVAALVLAANPNLTYRDVQLILLLSARHYDLADPDLRRNGAGLRISHNVGFGVPDAGAAVDLARLWPNRPAATRITLTNTVRQTIPDDALRVVGSGTGIPSTLTSLRCLPAIGPHADQPTAALPLVYVGQANEDLTQSLAGKAALIQRGTSYFSDKITRAAKAGAAFAVIFNNVGTTGLVAMGGTTFTPIPAVSIGRTDGESLRDFVSTQPDATARIQLTPAVYPLTVTTPLVCEHVGLRLKTTHTCRSDVRVTLVSPMGTRSVLQAINTDSTAGPSDWTYWSTQHFLESSVGTWRVEVSDERSTLVRSGRSYVPATGDVTYVELIIEGVAIQDADHDGLDDRWEQAWFHHMDAGPAEDADGDGFSNAREQVMGTDPTTPNARLAIDLAEFGAGYWRLSWPAQEGMAYSVDSTTDLDASFRTLGTVTGRLPVTEYVTPRPPQGIRFYRVQAPE